MPHDPEPEPPLTSAEGQDFRRLAGIMLPASAEGAAPGADDPAIFADIVGSLGRDLADVRRALAELRQIAGGAFAALDAPAAEAAAMALLDRRTPVVGALGRAVLQCYYRDDRVFAAIGREPRPPFPVGHKLETGDFALLDPVRARPRMWRDVDGARGGPGDGEA